MAAWLDGPVDAYGARHDDLSTPRGSPGGAVYDPDACARFAERLARFLGTGRYLASGDVTNTAPQAWYGLIDDDAVINGRNALKQRGWRKHKFVVQKVIDACEQRDDPALEVFVPHHHELHTLDDVRNLRLQQIAFVLTKELLDRYFRDSEIDACTGRYDARLRHVEMQLDLRISLHACVQAKMPALIGCAGHPRAKPRGARRHGRCRERRRRARRVRPSRAPARR